MNKKYKALSLLILNIVAVQSYQATTFQEKAKKAGDYINTKLANARNYFFTSSESQEETGAPQQIFYLIKAVKEEQPQSKIAQLIKNKKQDINQQDNLGNTALHYAVIQNKPDLVILLVTHNAQAGISNKEGKTPLALAALNNNKELVKELLKASRTLVSDQDVENMINQVKFTYE